MKFTGSPNAAAFAAAFAICLSATALTLPAVFTPAAAQQKVIDGRGVTYVEFNGGAFGTEGGNSWSETNKNGKVVFRFRETGRDEWSVYLVDESRGVNLQIDLFKKMIFYADKGNPTLRPLYPITHVEGNARVVQKAPEPKPPSSREIVNERARDMLDGAASSRQLSTSVLDARLRSVGRLLASGELTRRNRRLLTDLTIQDQAELDRRQARARPEPIDPDSRSRNFGPAIWEFSRDGRTATATLARTSDCRRDCNDEIDYEAIISIDCKRGDRSANIIFWTLGEERDEGRRRLVIANVDGERTRLRARGQSSLNGVSLKAEMPLDDPFFADLAAGNRLRYRVEDRRVRRGSLKGSGRAIRSMLSHCLR
jgi:hypothetical protein